MKSKAINLTIILALVALSGCVDPDEDPGAAVVDSDGNPADDTPKDTYQPPPAYAGDPSPSGPGTRGIESENMPPEKRGDLAVKLEYNQWYAYQNTYEAARQNWMPEGGKFFISLGVNFGIRFTDFSYDNDKPINEELCEFTGNQYAPLHLEGCANPYPDDERFAFSHVWLEPCSDIQPITDHTIKIHYLLDGKNYLVYEDTRQFPRCSYGPDEHVPRGPALYMHWREELSAFEAVHVEDPVRWGHIELGGRELRYRLNTDRSAYIVDDSYCLADNNLVSDDRPLPDDEAGTCEFGATPSSQIIKAGDLIEVCRINDSTEPFHSAWTYVKSNRVMWASHEFTGARQCQSGTPEEPGPSDPPADEGPSGEPEHYFSWSVQSNQGKATITSEREENSLTWGDFALFTAETGWVEYILNDWEGDDGNYCPIDDSAISTSCLGPSSGDPGVADEIRVCTAEGGALEVTMYRIATEGIENEFRWSNTPICT